MKNQNKDIAYNNKLRNKVRLLINEYGVKQSFICSHIEEHKGSFNGWVKGARDYDNSRLYKLNKMIETKYGSLINNV